jgi:hypothetical protein
VAVHLSLEFCYSQIDSSLTAEDNRQEVKYYVAKDIESRCSWLAQLVVLLVALNGVMPREEVVKVEILLTVSATLLNLFIHSFSEKEFKLLFSSLRLLVVSLFVLGLVLSLSFSTTCVCLAGFLQSALLALVLYSLSLYYMEDDCTTR